MNGGNGTKILVRARKSRMLAGVCAGVAGYFGIDVTPDPGRHRHLVPYRRHGGPSLRGGLDHHPGRRRDELDRPEHRQQEAERVTRTAAA